MKQMKRILSLVLLLTMLLSVLPMSVGAAGTVYKGSCGEGVNWTLDTETRTLRISGNGKIMDYSNDESVPWYKYRGYVQTVIVEDGVTAIGDRAFVASTNMKAISLPEGITRIGAYAFYGVKYLEEITLPVTVTAIANNAFEHCSSLKEITIPKNVEGIGDWAFRGCSSLKEVKLFDGLERIGRNAFAGCALEEIIIPDTVTSIKKWAFLDNQSLKKAILSDNVEVLYGTFDGCINLVTLKLPKKLKSIEGVTFRNCKKLKGVVLPEGLETIGYHAFYGTAIEQIILPSSLKALTSSGSFLGNNNLKKIAVLSADCEYDTLGCAALGIVGTTTVYCYPNSTTYAHAVKHGFAIEYITEDNLWVDEIEIIPDAPDPEDNPFKDVKEKDYFFSSVLWAVEKGITAGVSATSFAPNDVCTRAQIVSFLWRAKGQPEPKTQKNPFADVKSSDYFYKAVLWAVENGITAGVDATHFAPNNACTRAQAAAFLHRSEGNSQVVQATNPFKDVSSKEYYYNAVLWAVKNEITAGTSSTTFSPNDYCTRAQIVAFLYRAYH